VAGLGVGALLLALFAMAALTPLANGSGRERAAQVGGAATVSARPIPSWKSACARRTFHGRRVFVRRGAALGKLIARKPERTTFCVRAGMHRFTQALVPKSGSSFIGQPGAIFSGAREITRLFVKAGSIWAASGMTMDGTFDPGYRPGPCESPRDEPDSTLCLRTNDVYYDDRLLTRVGSLSKLSPGKFFFDYANDKIYIANRPSGHEVEVGVAPQSLRSFRTDATNVTVRGIVIEKFATPAASYALEGKAGWIVDHVEVRLNHACGVTAPVLRGSLVHDNGQCGFGSGDGPVLVEGNEFYENHRIPIAGWHTAAVKISRSRNAVIRDNYAHDEDGLGLWTDWDNIGTLYDGNKVERTGGPGIFHEASFDAVIRDNVVRGSGFNSAFDGWIDGSGILVNSSANVQIFRNRVEGNHSGIGATNTDRGASAVYGRREVRNLDVHDNVIAVRSLDGAAPNRAGGVAGVISQPFVRQAFFDHNRYTICRSSRFAGPDPSAPSGQTYLDWREWQAAGEDPNSTVSFAC
jgi:Right handed beta helix region